MLQTIDISHAPRGTRRPTLSRGKGFTLAEILIALGIMAIGMSMAAALFPAAIKENEQGTKNVMGQLVGSNALVVAQLALKGSVIDVAPNSTSIILLADGTTAGLLFGITNTEYPARVVQPGPPPPNSGNIYGYVLFGRKIDMTTAGNPKPTSEYQLLAVSYKTNVAGDKVQGLSAPITPVLANGDTLLNTKTFTITMPGSPYNNAANLIGSPVILAGSGEYATVVGFDGANITLDHAFSATAGLIAGSNPALVVMEAKTSSPVMNVLETRTGLGG